MGLTDDFGGKIIAVDSAPLIYFIEQREPYLEKLRSVFQMVEEGQATLVTSVVTLLEVLVHPVRNNDESLASEYQDILLHGRNVTTLPVSVTIAQVAAELRAERNLKTPDALQLATAISHQADVFLTNDRDFGSLDTLRILRVSDLTD